MKLSAFQRAIQLQFDTLTKRVIDTTVKDYNREISRRSKKEVAFSDISDLTVEKTGTTDKYDCDFTCFEILGDKVRVSNEALGNALKQLSERKLMIILMFYFLEISDKEIAEILNMDRSTAFRIRKSTLEEIKNLVKEETVWNQLQNARHFL